MAEQPPSAITMLTEFFATEHIEATARRTGFVKRASKMTGKLFLALVTFGVWSDATTTLAQLAAKVTQLDDQLEISPEAIYQRMNKGALAFLQDLIRQALAKVHALEQCVKRASFPALPRCISPIVPVLHCQTGYTRSFRLWGECRKSRGQNSSGMGL